MEQIRRSVYETNSSSTHSITICSEEEITKWKNGELFYYEDGNKFVDVNGRNEILRRMILKGRIQTNWKENNIGFKGEIIQFDGSWKDRDEKVNALCTEENLSEITQTEIDKFVKANSYVRDIPCGYDEYFDSFEYLETYEEKYTTPKGEEIIAFGCYGYDG